MVSEPYKPYIESASPEVSANTLICLINQTNYLLDQQRDYSLRLKITGSAP